MSSSSPSPFCDPGFQIQSTNSHGSCLKGKAFAGLTINEWMNGWMEESNDEWMDGWITTIITNLWFYMGKERKYYIMDRVSLRVRKACIQILLLAHTSDVCDYGNLRQEIRYALVEEANHHIDEPSYWWKHWHELKKKNLVALNNINICKQSIFLTTTPWGRECKTLWSHFLD